MRMKRCDLSVVIPIHNEAANIPALAERLAKTLREMNLRHEVIFVDDGSTDGSFQVLKEFHDADPNVRVIRFPKNFGQTAALSAGFSHARGGIVIAMDADLQNDPADIPMLGL